MAFLGIRGIVIVSRRFCIEREILGEESFEMEVVRGVQIVSLGGESSIGKKRLYIISRVKYGIYGLLIINH